MREKTKQVSFFWSVIKHGPQSIDRLYQLTVQTNDNRAMIFFIFSWSHIANQVASAWKCETPTFDDMTKFEIETDWTKSV